MNNHNNSISSQNHVWEVSVRLNIIFFIFLKIENDDNSSLK